MKIPRQLSAMADGCCLRIKSKKMFIIGTNEAYLVQVGGSEGQDRPAHARVLDHVGSVGGLGEDGGVVVGVDDGDVDGGVVVQRRLPTISRLHRKRIFTVNTTLSL